MSNQAVPALESRDNFSSQFGTMMSMAGLAIGLVMLAIPLSVCAVGWRSVLICLFISCDSPCHSISNC